MALALFDISEKKVFLGVLNVPIRLINRIFKDSMGTPAARLIIGLSVRLLNCGYNPLHSPVRDLHRGCSCFASARGKSFLGAVHAELANVSNPLSIGASIPMNRNATLQF